MKWHKKILLLFKLRQFNKQCNDYGIPGFNSSLEEVRNLHRNTNDINIISIFTCLPAFS